MDQWNRRYFKITPPATAHRLNYLVGFWSPPPLMFDAFLDETDLRGRSFTFELFLAAMVSLLWW